MNRYVKSDKSSIIKKLSDKSTKHKTNIQNISCFNKYSMIGSYHVLDMCQVYIMMQKLIATASEVCGGKSATKHALTRNN